jgi:CheY-like chemotaxis protein
VEDNPGDIRLVEEAFKEGGFGNCRLNVARDGEQAIAFLHQETPFENSPLPTFILLDLNLPLNGDAASGLAKPRVVRATARLYCN